MADQLNDAQLSERVCKALGIEPLSRDLPNGLRRDLLDAPIYPNVLDWPGFGLVVERLRESDLGYMFGDREDGHAVELYSNGGTHYGSADTLPRALALAVRAWKEGR
jgi:hypothetical protein